MSAIALRDVHKAFRIPHEVHTTLTERILTGFRRVTYERFEALRGIDLTIERGGFVGIVGGNGAGKSTLLKIMSGLLVPDAGTVRVDGSLSALLELGLGFNPELTVRENVEMYAALLGYPRRQVRRRVDEAIEFADLERFRDAKLKSLSTGMRARLGFATAIQAESDILLLDEILAVGDADFQLKCLNVFEEYKQQRKTIVLVSHDLGQVQRFCDHAVWLSGGRVAAEGDPDVVIERYLETVGTTAAPARPAAHGRRRFGDGRVRVLRGWIENESGQRVKRVRAGERPTLVVLVEVIEDTDHPVFGVAIHTEDGALVYTANTKWQGLRTGSVGAGLVVEVRAPFTAALRNGRYVVWAGACDRHLTTYHDVVEGVAEFVINDSICRDGIVDLNARLTFRVGVDTGAAAREDPDRADAASVRQQKGVVR